MAKPNMAMIGMSVMGSNFAQNFAEKGYNMAMWNRTGSKTEDAYNAIPDGVEYKSRLYPITGDIGKLVEVVGPQGTYFVMVKADDPFSGETPTQDVINQLKPHLQSGAIIVDCANSYWRDTNRRCKEFQGTGIDFFGTGVSGGEEGARHGPAIMPGGTSREVYEKRLKVPLEAVAAKAPQDNKPCVSYIGNNGAGHFVKMVHNGIEYGDMQLIAEAYDIMSGALEMPTESIANVFSKWNDGPLDSYLIQITATVLDKIDPRDQNKQTRLVDRILDAAQMKGTGTWTIMSSLDLASGVEPIPTIYAAVASRAMSSKKEARVKMAEIIPLRADIPREYVGDRRAVIDDLEKALFISKLASYTQGMALIRRAAEEYGFGDMNMQEIPANWRAGCIIRAKFLGDITEAFREDPSLYYLVSAKKFRSELQENMESIDKLCRLAATLRIPAMAFNASRDYLLQLTSARLPANLTQGQRDYFGAHQYERTDEARGKKFHINWMTDGNEVQMK